MNITFISNYFNHHQKNFSDCLNDEKDISFTFIATSKISDERKKLLLKFIMDRKNKIIEIYAIDEEMIENE